MRSLNNCGLNPQSDVNKLDVTDIDLIEVFSPSKRFITFNSNLHHEALEELKEKYWHCYGMDDVTNDIFMKWFVLGTLHKRRALKLIGARLLPKLLERSISNK